MTKRDLILILEPFTDDIEIVGPDLGPLYGVYDHSGEYGLIVLTDVPITRNEHLRVAVLGDHTPTFVTAPLSPDGRYNS